MKAGKSLAILTMAGALALGMAGCGTSSGDPTGAGSTAETTAAETTAAPTPVTLTMAGWSLDTTPEFKLLADGFHAANPQYTIDIKEYDPSKYGELMLADLSAGAAPDLVPIKEAKVIYQWSSALKDVSDVAAGLPKDVAGVDAYTVDGKVYASPYRMDSWILFYNTDLFAKAGIPVPDGKWTWEQYAATAKELTTKLAAEKSPDDQAIKGTYEHSWQSTLQGFANAQAGDIFSGDYSYMKPYYERVLDLQKAGAQETLATITTNKLTYQASFGKQHAAMMLMGSWYLATLTAQQASGDADTFAWGVAPAPQVDASTTSNPVTFGGPTGMAINSKISADKLEAAKAFLAYIASADAGKALAGIGNVPSSADPSVITTLFAQKGMPTDDLSKFALSTHIVKPENPVGENIAALQTILGEAHTAIMTEATALDAALADAGARAHSEGGVS
ncbi:MAG: extracellular solute-binding protein [Propionibacteriaceae bacterium]|jgi:multiple sugar transport system substrate-binding protein|nr:extracellular solute-binding protein [Propionibacteriaceae bacterium]